MKLPKEFYKSVPLKTEAELYEIIGNQEGYVPEAIALAIEELKNRNQFDPTKITEIETIVESKKVVVSPLDQKRNRILGIVLIMNAILTILGFVVYKNGITIFSGIIDVVFGIALLAQTQDKTFISWTLGRITLGVVYTSISKISLGDYLDLFFALIYAGLFFLLLFPELTTRRYKIAIFGFLPLIAISFVLIGLGLLATILN